MKKLFSTLALAMMTSLAATAQTVQNANYSTSAHIKKDGTVQNSTYSTIGYIKSDGTVQDKTYHTIGHAKDVKPAWAALLFFFQLLK